MFSPRNNKYSLVEHLQDNDDDDDDDEGLLSRYRVIASGPFPAKVDCSEDGASSQLLDACIVGGVLWKLQQFCRLQQKGANFWRTHGLLLGIYVLLILGLGMVLEGGDNPQDETTPIPMEHDRWKLGLGLVVITVFYFLVLVFLGAGLWISQTFRTKLSDYVREISEELEPLGLRLAEDTKSSHWLFRSSHIRISLKKRTSSPINALPPVAEDFLKDPSKETKTTVESILYFGGHNPSLSIPERKYPLPVDDWIAGGLMMRLRKERHRARQCSRILAFLVLLPIGGIGFLHLILTATTTNSEEEEAMVFHPLHVVAALVMAGVLSLIYFYLREFLDGSAVHALSRTVVKQFSGLAKERHEVSLNYEVQPGDCLPRTTKGVIRFQPTAMVSQPVEKRKPKATLAFV